VTDEMVEKMKSDKEMGEGVITSKTSAKTGEGVKEMF